MLTSAIMVFYSVTRPTKDFVFSGSLAYRVPLCSVAAHSNSYFLFVSSDRSSIESSLSSAISVAAPCFDVSVKSCSSSPSSREVEDIFPSV